MRTKEYLYDVSDMVPISHMPYKQAIEYKIELANKLLSKLLNVQYELRDTVRVREVLNAIKFNKELLKELE